MPRLITTTTSPLTAWEDPGTDYLAEYSEYDRGWQVWERYPGGRYVSLGIVSATSAEDAIRRRTEEDDDDRPEAPGLEEQPILDGCEEVMP